MAVGGSNVGVLFCDHMLPGFSPSLAVVDRLCSFRIERCLRTQSNPIQPGLYFSLSSQLSPARKHKHREPCIDYQTSSIFPPSALPLRQDRLNGDLIQERLHRRRVSRVDRLPPFIVAVLVHGALPPSCFSFFYANLQKKKDGDEAGRAALLLCARICGSNNKKLHFRQCRTFLLVWTSIKVN